MADYTDFVRRAYETFAAGDIPAVLAMMDPRIEWFEAENSLYWSDQPYIGPEQVLERVFARLQEDFDEFTIGIQRIVGCGDTVLVEARYGGVAKSTGKALNGQAAHVWDLVDGRFVRFQQYVDTWHLAQVTAREPAAASGV